MKRFSLSWCLAMVFGLSATLVSAQQEPGPFDFGKMWTFENPPKEWFKEAYGMDIDQSWFDEGRESALRFASWCSASFVSPDGLVMTNHHCSQPVVSDLQRDGENFDRDGFYAPTLADERRNDELFVEQLIKVADVTKEVTDLIGNPGSDEERMMKTQEATQAIAKKYEAMSGWENLRVQIVTYYSGARYSAYGYKRYDDVRLVFIPELQLGFFGGDPDNFTYPRYNLDCTFWRVYENGQPLNTSGNYFKFNTDGIHDGTPVFVIGNPGSTERYRTVAQLEFDRDYRYPVDIEFYKNRMKMLEDEYVLNPNDDLKNQIFSLSNTLKAVSGTLKGLHDPELFDRKIRMENKIRMNAGGKTYWTDMANYYAELKKHSAELRFLTPSPLSGGILPLLYAIHNYEKEAAKDPAGAGATGLAAKIQEAAPVVNDAQSVAAFGMVLGELKKFAQADDTYLNDVLKGRTPEQAAREICAKSDFGDPKALEKLFDKDGKKLLKGKDPLVDAASILYAQYDKAVTAYQSTGVARKQLEQGVAGEVFKVYGNRLPPDATFTLRISDGKVKNYEYNGTLAPIKTTYFGLYDRWASNDGQFPWNLPEKWLNPPLDLLKSPMNFISTCDIIGGNSGSAIINANRECVGLVFDGNIESLPGKFIFDEKNNRTVAVHAGGIVAALRYIYKADRLVRELTGQ